MGLYAYISELSYLWAIIPGIHKLKEERFNLAHGLRGFSLWLAGSKAQTLWQEGCDRAKLLGSWWPRGRAREQHQRGDNQTETPCASMTQPDTPSSMLYHSPGWISKLIKVTLHHNCHSTHLYIAELWPKSCYIPVSRLPCPYYLITFDISSDSSSPLSLRGYLTTLAGL